MPRARIDGIYELGHVLYALNDQSHGFARADIGRVERFWTFGDLHSSSAGFVFALKDGRRAYVDFLHTHAFEQIEDFRIEVQFLTSAEDEPEISPDHLLPPEGPPGGWSTDTAHLGKWQP